MTEADPHLHLRPDHHYPALPPGILICDDEEAGGDYFLYRDRQLIVHQQDQPRVQRLLASRAGLEYEIAPSPVHQPLRLFSLSGPNVDTVEVLRSLRAAAIPDGPQSERAAEGRQPPRVWFNHVVGLQTHLAYGNKTYPEPRPALSPLPVGRNLPGSNVRVGVLDTGIQDQRWFGRRWTQPLYLRERDVTEQVALGTALPPHAGHGSFIAGLILQHAPGALVVVDRLEHMSGCISDWELQTPLVRLLDPANQIDVLNLSFGGYTSDNLPLPAVESVLTTALDARPELVVVASAGNDGIDRRLWPAALDRVVAVGALDAYGTGRWPDSNRGDWVGAWSIGEDLASTFLQWPGQRPARGRAPDRGPWDYTGRALHPQRFDGWATWSGTSFAAARVSGAIAAELKRDARSPRRVVFDLVRNAPRQYESGGVVEPATFVS